nr:hypothetical protein [Candidatus Sigynarchaeum springense]
MAQAPSYTDYVNIIMKATGLGSDEIKKRVDDKIAKFNNLLTDIGAVFMVGDDLHVSMQAASPPAVQSSNLPVVQNPAALVYPNDVKESCQYCGGKLTWGLKRLNPKTGKTNLPSHIDNDGHLLDGTGECPNFAKGGMKSAPYTKVATPIVASGNELDALIAKSIAATAPPALAVALPVKPPVVPAIDLSTLNTVVVPVLACPKCGKQLGKPYCSSSENEEFYQCDDHFIVYKNGKLEITSDAPPVPGGIMKAEAVPTAAVIGQMIVDELKPKYPNVTSLVGAAPSGKPSPDCVSDAPGYALVYLPEIKDAIEHLANSIVALAQGVKEPLERLVDIIAKKVDTMETIVDQVAINTVEIAKLQEKKPAKKKDKKAEESKPEEKQRS